MIVALNLRQRNHAALVGLIDAGRHVNPEEYAVDYGPDQRLVVAGMTQLRRSGLKASWSSGDPLMRVSGDAQQIKRAFSVPINQYIAPDGSRFYASPRVPRLVGVLRSIVTSIIGLDNYHRIASLEGPSFTGYSPSEVLGAYHFGPLLRAGLNGQGETVVFLEIDQYSASDLTGYAKRFDLPPFIFPANWVHTDPEWGTANPFDPKKNEVNLDLEIVHALAPAASLVIYDAGANMAGVILAAQQAVKDFPSAIFSVSLGACELHDSSDAGAFDGIFAKLAMTGGTAFVSSGDSGAYGCVGEDGTYRPNSRLSVSVPSSDPFVTAVGGTALFVGSGNTYGREAAWANPTTQWAGGGGLSSLFARPSWQQGPGVQNHYSNGMREVPDVSGLADGVTGWAIEIGGAVTPVGGTSAAAPMWAGLTALTDQALAQRHLRTVGFADPMLYYLGVHRNLLPAPPFHDITMGNNLYYPATAGWDYATGLGSPDASAFVDDAIAYESAVK